MRYEDLVYHKGDIYIAELGENFGHEQSGTRPVIIMQNDCGKLLFSHGDDCSIDLEGQETRSAYPLSAGYEKVSVSHIIFHCPL